jgi:alkanesulfonate monooxygenase SsuD/methylene tetrahydromethanopterin reductase-like flavin-dependent oxidoreductase (luciferase family)
VLGRNRFKLGGFAINCSGGLTMTKAPERWEASWDNNLNAARMAEEAGFEFLLPIARWHGYGGETDTEGTSLETLTWAAGILASTREITVFGTVHVPLINPVFAAKQAVTADHIGKGRFGLNIVSGWSASEFEMFGTELLPHDERYAYAEEWLAIVKRIWAETEPFSFEGRYFDLKGVLSRPKPVEGERPILMSAGSSKAGRAFAARHADCLFMTVVDLDTLAGELRTLRAAAGDRPIGVYGSGHMICRPTQKEAEEYYHYIVYEMGDWAAVEHAIAIRQKSESIPPARLPEMKERLISGVGTFPIVGSADHAAGVLKRLSDSGLDGMAIGLVNYIDDLPYIRAELLPRMEKLGLRVPPGAALR